MLGFFYGNAQSTTSKEHKRPFTLYTYSYDTNHISKEIGTYLQTTKIDTWTYYLFTGMTETGDSNFRLTQQTVYNQKGVVQEATYFTGSAARTSSKQIFKNGKHERTEHYYGDRLYYTVSKQLRNKRHMTYYHPNGQISAEGNECYHFEYLGCLGKWPVPERSGLWKFYDEEGNLVKRKIFKGKE